MKKKASRNQRQPQTKNTSAPRRSIAGAVLLLVGFVLLAAGGLWWHRQHQSKPADEGAVRDPMSAFARLKGAWQRPDGGYVIQVKGVGAGGAMDAAYLNPNPIHVAKAQASVVSNSVRVFIELRDVNYPGATYRLTYLPRQDLLAGLYHQPLIGQTFEVVFQRLKP